MRVLLVLFASFCCQVTLGQNQPCDKIINSGEVDCLWQQIGSESCPNDQSNMCQANNPCVDNQISIPWSCLDSNGAMMGPYGGQGVEVLSTSFSVPKYSQAPVGQNGRPPIVTSGFACKRFYKCICEGDESGLQICRQTPCGLAILLNVTPDNNPMVFCLTVEPPID